MLNGTIERLLRSGKQARMRTFNGTVMGFDAGEVIHREGDPADTLYTIVSGVVVLTRIASDGEERSTAILSAGEVFGDDFMTEQVYLTTANALTPVQLKAVGYDLLGERDLPFLLWNAAERYRRLLEYTARMLTSSVQVKVCEVLVRLMSTELSKPQEDGTFHIRISQQQLSDLAHTRRESTAKVLGELRKQGVVVTGYNTVVVLEPLELVEVAEGFGD